MDQFEFIQKRYPKGYFDAIEFAYETIEKQSNVMCVTIYGTNNHQYDFMISDNYRALLKKCVMRKGEINFFNK